MGVLTFIVSPVVSSLATTMSTMSGVLEMKCDIFHAFYKHAILREPQTTNFWSFCLLSCFYLFFAYSISLTIYRLYFHPLARFPGPKSVAATRWVEFYYDVVRGGRFMWQIEKMHQKFGPIIRVSPDEIHIMDSQFYDAVYVRKYLDKYPSWCNLAAARNSVLTTSSHSLHRLRRSALNPFFSKQSIARLESVIQEKLDKLCSRFKEMAGTSQLFRFEVAFMALTSDIISEYAFCTDYGHLDDPDFSIAWYDTIVAAVSTGALLRQFPFVSTIIKSMPTFILNKSRLGHFSRLKRDMRAQICSIMAKPSDERNSNTIFHALLDSSLPEKEKTLSRLTDEGQILYGAGSETTAKTLATIVFHLMRNKHIASALRTTLFAAKASAGNVKTLPLSHLEKLPYLMATVQEGLRLTGGVTTRTPRVSPTEPLVYGSHVIPAGTPVSQTAYFVLMDPLLFPFPTKFRPERWLVSKRETEDAELDWALGRFMLTYEDAEFEYNHELARSMVAFGRGSRSCIGQYLAYAELLMAVAELFGGGWRFELEKEVDEEDVVVRRDAFVGAPAEGRGKLWAKVVSVTS